ncbi:hypothetical protein QAD02_014947 [Eretmocerus hayati]|uniref:Uncharacterized protein n=1 Tax=Eretmocerus hayati TaxID=131215 RepID=A0ACC2P6W6_9HYME|nr:hypothetical protein QAD02_014947 [Eretmocerus hayati]
MDKYLLLMYDRPSEPLFVPKGNEKVAFDIPPEYLLEKYRSVAANIFNRFGDGTDKSVPITHIAIPDMTVPLKVGRYDFFSLHVPAHREAAEYLIKLFLGMRTIDDLVSLTAYCRDRVNSQMFIYCLSVAIIHRPDTKHLQLPQLHEIFPDKFIDGAAIARAKEEANIIPEGSRTPIEIPLDWTATDVDPEHKVAYWREDIGVNLHHWHWHLIYPFSGPPEIIAKDRRGELFLYYHHQMMARYNTERLSHNIGKTRPLANFREPIKEAYYPKLDSVVAGHAWPSRPPNMTLSDVSRVSDGIYVSVSDIERSRDAILDAVRARHVIDSQGKTIPLDDIKGIDILGNMIESSELSPNQALYKGLHNDGHILMSLIHDPDHRFLEPFGVMSSNATAMRDPLFYRWHQFVDDIVYQFLDGLAPYTTQQLSFPGITVKDVRVGTSQSNPNTLNTHWTKSDVEMSQGLDFFPRGPVLARIQHLNHDEFSYNIVVNNSNNREVIGTARIFISLKFDEKGEPLTFNEQRKFMIEMDKFTVRLKKGQNVIVRKSTESSLTIPFEVTFRDLNKSSNQNPEKSTYCECGWPQHMLLPKGTTRGYPMDLFVMVSNYELDKVNQAEPVGCTNSVSFCGLEDRKYPDIRPMGFPFDRKARTGVKSLTDFITGNMKVQPITIRFNDTIKPRLRSTRNKQG